MADRRVSQRFRLDVPADAHVRIFEEVLIEHVLEGGITAFAAIACPVNEELSLEGYAEDGRRMALAVTIVDCSPVIVEGTVRHRVRVGIADGRHERDALMPWRHVRMAVLATRIRARVLNVSMGGCLLEGARHLPTGTVGLLDIEHGTGLAGECIRVCHASALNGAPLPFLARCTFLILDAPAAASLRLHAVRLAYAYSGLPLAFGREMSGSSLTTGE